MLEPVPQPDPAWEPPARTFERVVPLVGFAHRSASRGEPWRGSLGGFFGRRHALRDELRGAPAFSLVARAPGEGSRKVGAVVLGYDLDPDAAFAHAELLAGWSFVLFTGFDHRALGDGCYRYRVVVPLSRPVGPRAHRVVAAAIDAALGGLAASGLEPWDGRWHAPVCPPERAHLATIRYGDGRVFDVDELLGTRLFDPHRRLA